MSIDYQLRCSNEKRHNIKLATQLSWPIQVHEHYLYSSFSQLGNSAISVKGKGLTNAKIYLERKNSSKGQI